MKIANDYDDLTALKKHAYEKYQLDWMISHGYSIRDILEIQREYFVSAAIDGILDSDMNAACDAAKEYFVEQGFNGELFVCYQEFLGAEYEDSSYMKYLLTEEEFLLWETQFDDEKLS